MQEYEYVVEIGAMFQLGGASSEHICCGFCVGARNTSSSAISHAINKAAHCEWCKDKNAGDDKEVPKTHTEDLSPNFWSHDLLVSVGFAGSNCWKGWFSTKGKGSKGVHDQVEPEELHS